MTELIKVDNKTKPTWDEIDTAVYDWSAKVFRTLKKLLKVNLRLHAEQQVAQGDIFLFNHFSRFESFIPQYLIYEETGDYCYSIGSSEFFKEDNTLSTYLKQVGVISHQHQRLFPILAEQVLKGRKVIIFPEGGMVKDRKVLDQAGKYAIFSRITGKRREHHTGAAVLAHGIDAFKATVREAYYNKETDLLLHWKNLFALESLDQLLLSALKPTNIVPSCITFYPIRSNDNLLHNSVKLFADGLSLRQTEELLIEGNIILKNTDMDIRMGQPITPYQNDHWWDKPLTKNVTTKFKDLDDAFAISFDPQAWQHKLLAEHIKICTLKTRDIYMREMYKNITINLSHVASTLIIQLQEAKRNNIEKSLFNRIIYIAIKRLQCAENIYLHESLNDPNEYEDLMEGHVDRFEQFFETTKRTGLIIDKEDTLYFQSKIMEDFHFDAIRMENVIAVYYNEAMPIEMVRQATARAILDVGHIPAETMALWYLDDECLMLKQEKAFYQQSKFEYVNSKETATEDPEPFILQPIKPNGIGILLIHGLLASPAELRNYGHYLAEQGFTVLGIRIKGHGTSPADLRTRSCEDWYESVTKGLRFLSDLMQNIIVIGFSTGAALALKLAADQPNAVTATVVVSVPIKFVDPSIMLVSILHGTNKLVAWASSLEGVKPFTENDPEHPTINYRNIPIRSLYELRKLVQEIEGLLPSINMPVLNVYADQDPVVEPESSNIVMTKLGSTQKKTIAISSHRHGILMENIAGTWQAIDEFLEQFIKA